VKDVGAEAGGSKSLLADRQKFAQELQNNPELRDKILRIASNEQGANPQGTQAVLESMMNRASVRGTSLEQQARWYGTEKGGYYQRGSMGRGALEDPRQRKILENSLINALGGSNAANFATDNASSGLAAREEATGTFRAQAHIHGETFFSPGTAEKGLVPKWQRWQGGVSGGETTGQVSSGQLPHWTPGGISSSLTGGGGGDVAAGGQTQGIPSRFASDLTAMTLAGAKPHNIHAYMLSHGINLSEATCGQFMASVVKAHGGVPPASPAVASSWNNFGGVQGAGYSSDPNAINIAVRQGTPTGSTGGHVTSAIPILDESGKITGFRGVGVNQGQGEGAERGVGTYGRDVISSKPLSIGTGRGQYQIRHEIIPQAAADNDRTKIDKSLAAQGSESRKISNAKVDISLASTQSAHWQHMFKDVRQHQTPPMGKAGSYGGDASNQHKEE
jgi:uncharacterized protein YneF (UPF0154 family)